MKTSSRKLKIFVAILLVFSTILIAGTLIFITTTERGQTWSEEFKKNAPEVPSIEVETPQLEKSSTSKYYETQLEDIQKNHSLGVIEEHRIYAGDEIERHMKHSKDILDEHIEKSRERLEDILGDNVSF